MYTETFTFSFVHYCLDSLGINLWPPFQACDGRLAQLMMTLAAVASLHQTMEILAAVGMTNFVFPHLFSIPKSALQVCHHQHLGDERELGVLASIHTTNLPTHSPPQIP